MVPAFAVLLVFCSRNVEGPQEETTTSAHQSNDGSRAQERRQICATPAAAGLSRTRFILPALAPPHPLPFPLAAWFPHSGVRAYSFSNHNVFVFVVVVVVVVVGGLSYVCVLLSLADLRD